MKLNFLVERIGYFRSIKNLSARELSLRINKNDAYINHLESSKFSIKLSVLFDILEALEITCEEFFADDYANYKQDKEIFNLIKALPKDRKNAFIDLMKNTK